jgi:hypothetical protein
MTIGNAGFSVALMLLLALCSSCANAPRSAGHDESAAADAEKTLIPHPSWTCGMPDGIPKPEDGVPVFEAEMKLDQVYDVGRTQHGWRQVLVVQGGPVTGARIQGSVLPGGLDFQLTLSNGVEARGTDHHRDGDSRREPHHVQEQVSPKC